MSTVACRGTEHTLENLLQALQFPTDQNPARSKRWKAGVRSAEGHVHEIHTKRLLGPALVLWVPASTKVPAPAKVSEQEHEADKEVSKSKRQKVKLDRKIMIRVHPSVFKDFWVELLRAAKMQKPQVLVEDLRFEIGSLHVTGPASTEALLGVLRSRSKPTEAEVAAQTWRSLVGLSNPASLPLRVLLSFDIVDPRLDQPPNQLKANVDQDSLDSLTRLVADWPADNAGSTMALASHKARWIASTRLPSQKSINRRKAAAGPGQAIPVAEKDPAIPIVVLAHRAATADSNAQGSWTVLLPWCCVDVVWRSLQYYPISSGSTPRFGGLYQTQQLAFEHMIPWFPADMPGTVAGQAWERTESEKRFDMWIRRPPSRRLRWDLVDIGLGRRGELGRGWTCDWEYLFRDTSHELGDGPGRKEQLAPADRDVDMPDGEEPARRRRNTSSPETSPEPEAAVKTPEPELDFFQLTPQEAAALLKPRKLNQKGRKTLDSMPAIATVRIQLLTKGTPQPGARIYRLPVRNSSAKDSTQPLSPTATSTKPPAQTSAPMSSLPASADVHTSTLQTATDSTSSAPPAAQRPSSPTPSTQSDFLTLAGHKSTTPLLSLREKWLALAPSSFYTSSNSGPKLQAKSHPSPHTAYPSSVDVHNLSLINVYPPKASAELIAKFNTHPTEAQLAEFEDKELLRELLKNDAVALENDGKEVNWDVSKGLVECPDKEDLIGFVTSGEYNLREGRGTAVGGVWVQSVREGWVAEEGFSQGEEKQAMEKKDTVDGKASSQSSSDKQSGKGKRNGKEESTADTQERQARESKERKIKERTLCVVRNAGSGVGRLGWWEVCE